MKIIDVTGSNVEKLGFFCKMSQKKSNGYKRKLEWLKARFDEGMRIKMLDLSQGGRGFIEYIPGRFAWRAVHAEEYMFIHCIWVVGKSKGNGYAKMLLNESIKDAEKAGMKGVAMITSEGNWLISKRMLESRGFASVDNALPSFNLMVKKFGEAKDPYFPDDWEKRCANFGRGMTVIRTDQCPYLDDAVNTASEFADKEGIKFHSIELNSAEEIRKRVPSPYGVFSIVLDGKLFSYHYLLPREFKPKYDALA
jgi:hypothetical protein